MERFTSEKIDYQRWFDYEYKGFHLLLNLDEVQNYEYPKLVHVLENMIKRIQTQQKMTNSQGIVKLKLEDEVIEHLLASTAEPVVLEKETEKQEGQVIWNQRFREFRKTLNIGKKYGKFLTFIFNLGFRLTFHN